MMKITRAKSTSAVNNLLAPFVAFIVLEFGFAMAVNALYDEGGDDDLVHGQPKSGPSNKDTTTYYYVFAIWGIIYALQVSWMGYTLYGLSKRYRRGSCYVNPPLFSTT